MSADWTPPEVEELRELGRGASGHVALARHLPTGRHIAVKHLSPALASDPEFLAGFRTEARLLADVADPHIVALYEYVQSGPHAVMLLELVRGVPLRAMLDHQDQPLLPEAALSVLKGSLLGLAAAHDRGVVHRDYKPANVLVDDQGETRLIDFGIATRAGREVAVAGTPEYMAPEQWEGAPASAATDVYAATAVFVECLTGRTPYAADTITALRLQHLNAAPALGDVPGPLRALVTSGLAKRADKRPASARAFVAELEAAAVEGYGEGWEERGRRELRRLALLLAALFPAPAVAGGGLGAFALTILGRVAIGAAAGTAAIFAIAHVAAPSGSATPVSAPVASFGATLGPASGPAPTPGSSASASTPARRTDPAAPSPGSVITTGRTAAPPPVSTHVTAPRTTPAGPHTTTTTAATPPPTTTAAPPPAPAVHLGKATLAVNGSSTTVDATVSVFASNTQTFTVRLKYSDGAVDTFTESGATSYTVTDTHSFTSCPNPPGTWSVTAVTTPAADNVSVSSTPEAC